MKIEQLTHETVATAYLEGYAKGVGYKKAFSEMLLHLSDDAIVNLANDIQNND